MSEQDFNLGEILGRVMSDPALMASLKSTAQTLFGEGVEGGAAREGSSQEGPTAASKGADGEPIMPSFPEKEEQPSATPPALPHEHSKSEENEQRIRLLLALKPYMDEGRRGKIDTLLRIMNLMKLSELGGLLKGLM